VVKRLLVDAACVLGLAIHVESGAAVVLREELFDLPVVDLGTDAELEVFLGDGIPELEAVSNIP
jgi:hypothetical protein